MPNALAIVRATNLRIHVNHLDDVSWEFCQGNFGDTTTRCPLDFATEGRCAQKSSQMGPLLLSWMPAHCEGTNRCPKQIGALGDARRSRVGLVHEVPVVAFDDLSVLRVLERRLPMLVFRTRARSALRSRARSTSANFDFGQLFFSSSANSTSANFDFGQFRLRPISTSANF